ncbi:MAG TPA: redoxin domain-containing protein [Gemmatimonadaceae bacterium]|nr:redoxin domain-containing protein [Gemmatimonadaceae bacterium]
MEAYRDQYAKLFNGGKNVVVIAMSVDPDTALASWARDESFPVLFASDSSGAVGRSYGIWSPKYKLDTRVLFVIDPEGKISYRAMPFRELTADAYTQLAAAVDKTVGEAPAGGGAQ